MEKNYATSVSERPLSDGATNPNARDDAILDVNGIPVGDAAVGDPVVGDPVVGDTAVGDPVVGDPAVGEGVVAGGEVSSVRSGRSGDELFLLATFALGLIGWVTSTVSQAVVAATISRASVRILWFGFFIQTILTALVLLVILGSTTYNAAYAYGTQISIFAALATGFAVLGVDQNIYSDRAAEKATGAGWLIVAIINISWIIFFTSPPQSPVFSVAESLTASGARRREVHQNKVEKISRSTDAFALSPVQGGVGSTRRDTRASRASVPPQLPDPQNPRLTGGHWGLYTPPQKSGGRGTITSITSEPKTATASGRVRSVADLESHAGSVRPESGAAGPDEVVSQHVGDESKKSPKSAQEKVAQWKAEALFSYTAAATDPNELSFKKGEILHIIDKSGKWWEAQTRNGKTGIAPSNYLRLLE